MNKASSTSSNTATEEHSSRSWLQSFGAMLLAVVSSAAAWISFLLCLQSLAIFFSFLSPHLELANHFVVHGLGLSCILLPILILLRRPFVGGALFISICYLLFLFGPWSLFVSLPEQATSTQSRKVKVLSWNVLAINHSYQAIEELVQKSDADILVFIETRPNFFEQMPSIDLAYPHSLKILHWAGNGITLFSRVPGTTIEFQNFSLSSQRGIVATLTDETGQPLLKIAGIHPLSPLPTSRAIIRDQQINAMLDWSEQQTVPLCVCGDFNTTPWTNIFQKCLSSGFRDSRIGAGNCASWPADFGWLGIPIDHALTKGACSISDRRVLPNAPGSDHRPIEFLVHY